MDKLSSLYLVFVALVGLTSGVGVLPVDPVYKAVGETVKFETTLTTTAENPFGSIAWRFNRTTPIITSNVANNTNPEYEDRITLFISTGSLELRNLALSDSGEYDVSITQGLDIHDGSTTLHVLQRVSGVTVRPSSPDVVEGSSISLSCSVSSGSSLSFRWANGSSELTAGDRVQLTNGDSTLTINPVNRYDRGPFRCHVSNPVSNDTSDPINPLVSYGPEKTNLSVTPSQEHYAVGSDISLSCWADSRPDAHFNWFLNGDQQSDSGSELRLTDIQERQSGNYTCRSFNNKTMKTDTSMKLSISVLEKISDASVKPSPNQGIEGNSFNLTCDAAGSVLTRKWMKDGSDLTLAEHMTFYEENRVLSFKQLKKTDKGEYSCEISNPVSSMKATYSLVVNYGPVNVKIEGSDKVHIGGTIKLTCSADSEPSASFTWSVDGTQIPGANAAEFTKQNAKVIDSGNYTCQAKNDVTQRSQSAVYELIVSGTAPLPHDPCPVGCIVGIVIACLVVVGVAAGVGYFFYRKKKNQGNSSSSRAGGGGQDNSSFAGNKELNYADIAAFRRKDGGSVQIRPQESETSVYAQVRGSNNASTASSLPTYNAHMQRAQRQAPHVDDSQPYAQVRRN